MTYTEDVAKTKWCPEVKILLVPPQYEGGSAYIMTNRYGSNNYNCIASECMQWQWDGERGYCGKARKLCGLEREVRRLRHEK